MRISVDDGCASDVRVAELAKKYGIEAVFYWPVDWTSLALDNDYAPLSMDEAWKIAQDFEIGSHTVTHRHLTKLDPSQAKWEIWESKVRLMKLFDQPITKFCAPRGYTNEDLTKFTLEHYKSQRLTKGKGLVHIHPDSGANGNKPWRECITDETTECWMHSWELDRFNLWGELEGFLKETYRGNRV